MGFRLFTFHWKKYKMIQYDFELACGRKFSGEQLTNWLLELFAKKNVFWTVWWFSGWIWAKNLVEKVFATLQFALLATSITFYKNQKSEFWDEKVTYVSRLSIFAKIFRLSFSSFSFHFSAMIGLLLGLLAVKKLLRKHHQDRQFLPWSSQI